MKLHRSLAALAAGALFAASAQAQVLISDDFESDSSASYTIVDDSNAASGDGEADSTVTFNFDYSALGIAAAPNSSGGTSGLYLTVNNTSSDNGGDGALQEDHVTVFNNLNITAPVYTLSVDMYMGVEAGQSGSTEFAHIGVAGSTADFLSIFTPIVANGHFISITGEGGSSSDYRHATPGTPAVNSGDPSYLNSTNTTNATGDVYQALFPAPADFPGSPGNLWTTLTIDVTPYNVTYSLDGTPIIRTPVEENEGLVGLGYTDPFDSVGPHFVIYDNLTVTEVPEPATVVLSVLGLAGVAALRRARG
ncbi:MAG: hypothetical protein CMJ58_10135 [Planctomycetaceae bacterium]|nr:hypothetical protein [Planctomycetaceae bacterium]